MTQRQVENTRVHFWTFSPVSCNLQIVTYKIKYLGNVLSRDLNDYGILRVGLGMQIQIWRSKFPPPIHCARSTPPRKSGRQR